MGHPFSGPPALGIGPVITRPEMGTPHRAAIRHKLDRTATCRPARLRANIEPPVLPRSPTSMLIAMA